MKYMSFNSSCTLTAVANMLELLDINDVTDRELAKRLNLPYIFRYKENQFCAGAMNQNASIYNYYLKEMGFEFVEEELDVINLLPYLKLHPISMLGIKSESGKHAVVFLKQEADELVFLNPHYENDGKEDFLQIKTNQLSKLLEKKIMVGRIQKCHSQKMKVDFEASLEGLDIYLKEFDAFCSKPRTKYEIKERRDALFRAFAIDLIPMMEILKENTLLSLLTKFQQAIFKLIRIETETIPYDIVSKDLVEKIIDEYKRIITIKLKGEKI